jgi:hypothetical protein
MPTFIEIFVDNMGKMFGQGDGWLKIDMGS